MWKWRRNSSQSIIRLVNDIEMVATRKLHAVLSNIIASSHNTAMGTPFQYSLSHRAVPYITRESAIGSKSKVLHSVAIRSWPSLIKQYPPLATKKNKKETQYLQSRPLCASATAMVMRLSLGLVTDNGAAPADHKRPHRCETCTDTLFSACLSGGALPSIAVL